MEWTEENLLNLIELYRGHPVLWNPNDSNYFKKNNKIDAWAALASSCGGITPQEVRKKIESLLSSFRREKSKVKNSRMTGRGTSEIYVRRWFAYEAFQFLEDRDTPRQRFNTASISLENDDHDTSSFTNTDDEDDPPSLNASAGTENISSESTAGSDSNASAPVPSEMPANSNQTTSFVSPRTPVKRRKSNGTTALLTSAVDVLKSAAGNLVKERSPPNKEEKEVKAFTDHLASKMLGYSQITRTKLQHVIYKAMMKADLGEFETASVQQSHVPAFDPLSSSPRTYHYLSNSQSSYSFPSSFSPLQSVSPHTHSISPTNSENTSIHSPFSYYSDE